MTLVTWTRSWHCPALDGWWASEGGFLDYYYLQDLATHISDSFQQSSISSFTKRTGTGTHPSCVLRGLSQKVGIVSLNLSRLSVFYCLGQYSGSLHRGWLGPPSLALLTATLPWTGFRFLWAGRHRRVLPSFPRQQQVWFLSRQSF